MYDRSFSRKSLERVLQKRDFKGIPKVAQEAFKTTQLANAEAAALTLFGSPSNPLSSFPLKGKTVFHFPILANELVARRLCSNLRHVAKQSTQGRSQIVGNLGLLLEEGLPYRVYRLDVKSFYESFTPSDLASTLETSTMLSPHSKNLLMALFKSHIGMGGTGIPRGLSLSAVLSDLLMQRFDRQIFGMDEVFFFARYVDDIIIITSSRENSVDFIQSVEKYLPQGLKLNTTKKNIVSAIEKVSPTKPALPLKSLFLFDYLGYEFSVLEPTKSANTKDGEHFRKVIVDIAAAKIKKIKLRISRTFLAFSKNYDWSLLLDRIKFMTQNFSVYNSKVGSKKLAGIYHSYPQVSDEAEGLRELDRFLRNATLSKTGRIFSATSPMLTAARKRTLLAQSFERGHSRRTFIHFSATRISQIQQCWLN